MKRYEILEVKRPFRQEEAHFDLLKISKRIFPASSRALSDFKFTFRLVLKLFKLQNPGSYLEVHNHEPRNAKRSAQASGGGL